MAANFRGLYVVYDTSTMTGCTPLGLPDCKDLWNGKALGARLVALLPTKELATSFADAHRKARSLVPTQPIRERTVTPCARPDVDNPLRLR